MRLATAALAVLLAGLATCRATHGQEPMQNLSVPPEVVDKMLATQLVFSFKPLVASMPSWEISINPDRSGTYRELGANAASQPQHEIHVSEAVWNRLNAANATVRGGRCETKAKGIAQTGEKTLSLVMGPAVTSCKFNYSDDDKLNDTASAFQALASTLQFGAKLQHAHKFDKLALDADMDVLVNEVSEGRALEPANIAPILQSLVDDDHVIDRVRRKAARLLQPAVDKPR